MHLGFLARTNCSHVTSAYRGKVHNKGTNGRTSMKFGMWPNISKMYVNYKQITHNAFGFSR